MVLANTLKSYQMTNIEETYINIWLIYDPKWDNLILPWTHMNVVGQNSYAILDTSQPNVIGFCFNMGHSQDRRTVSGPVFCSWKTARPVFKNSQDFGQATLQSTSLIQTQTYSQLNNERVEVFGLIMKFVCSDFWLLAWISCNLFWICSSASYQLILTEVRGRESDWAASSSSACKLPWQASCCLSRRILRRFPSRSLSWGTSTTTKGTAIFLHLRH